MPSIQSLALDAADPDAAADFYDRFGVGDRVSVRAADGATSGFRGFTVSLVVSQPGNVDAWLEAALEAGATSLKPAKKSLWGYGGVVQAPDGAIWKAATSSKKDAGPAAREVEDLVLLLGVEDVKATRQFYVDRGLGVGKSFGSRYVEFDTPGSAIKLALYGRKALAKDAGVAPEGTGSHGIVIVDGAEEFTDPDGFAWAAA
jgi:hypothetical protein